LSANSPSDLQRIYEARFLRNLKYRRAVWGVLIEDFFQRFVAADANVLDLGCGYGEFISQVRCARKYAMDMNPDAPGRVGAGVHCFAQDCSAPWPLGESSLDVVFTSNFFEHLPDKAALGRTLDQIHRCLKPGGRLIAMGPNIRYLRGAYWDFWDHYVPLTEKSLGEALQSRAFRSELSVARFLPYTMAEGPQYPLSCLRLYLRLRWSWRFFGKQFLIVAER